jgi:NADPH-dependent curcumin reductase CurA
LEADRLGRQLKIVKTRAISLRGQVRNIAHDAFGIEERICERIAEGQLLIQTLWVSVDPYLVLRIRDNVFSDGRMISRVIGRVVESRSSDIAVGQLVLGFAHWQDLAVLNAGDARVIKPVAPLSTYLGAVGHSGFTAMLGIEILDPQPGQVITVSSAAGVVGSVATQLAKLAGAHVIGFASGQRAKLLTEQLGIDTGIDYRLPGFTERLAIAAPHGIDRHFENVGSTTLDPVLALMNFRSKIALCGLVEHYGNDHPVCLENFRVLLRRSIRMEAYHIEDHYDRYPEGLQILETLVCDGKLKVIETISQGLEALPSAFMGMLGGNGVGKNLVHVAD